VAHNGPFFLFSPFTFTLLNYAYEGGYGGE
jgi:hypothetical protein